MATTSLTPAQEQALLVGPAGTPPPGVRPNFEDPVSIYPQIIMALVLTLGLSTFALAIRAYTKLRIIKAWHLEDYFITLAWIGEIAEAVPAMLCVEKGAKVHMWDLRLRDFFGLLYYANASAITYGPTVALLKVAILLQLFRVFVPSRRGYLALYLTIFITMALIVVFYTIITIFTIAHCVPREAIWNKFYHGGFCFNPHSIYGATGIFNVISDFALLMIPIRPIWKLHMRRSKKIAVTALFATGLFACVTSIIRTYYTWMLMLSPDISWNIAIMGLWTWAEMSVGVLVCCLPVTPKFFSFVNPKFQSMVTSLLRTTTGRSSSGNNNSSNGGMYRLGSPSGDRSRSPNKTYMGVRTTRSPTVEGGRNVVPDTLSQNSIVSQSRLKDPTTTKMNHEWDTTEEIKLDSLQNGTFLERKTGVPTMRDAFEGGGKPLNRVSDSIFRYGKKGRMYGS